MEPSKVLEPAKRMQPWPHWPRQLSLWLARPSGNTWSSYSGCKHCYSWTRRPWLHQVAGGRWVAAAVVAVDMETVAASSALLESCSRRCHPCLLSCHRVKHLIASSSFKPRQSFFPFFFFFRAVFLLFFLKWLIERTNEPLALYRSAIVNNEQKPNQTTKLNLN